MTDNQNQPGPGNQKSDPGPQFLILGRIMRPHGIRGDLSVKVMTQFPERLTRLETVYLGRDADDPRKFMERQVKWARRAKNDQWLMHLEGTETRDDADLLRNLNLLVSLANAVPLEDDEVYLFQIMGLEVQTAEGETLGRVVDVIETGANDVYVVQGEQYGEVLIPAISGVILDTDVQAGIMKVQLPAGLLPDSTEEA